MNLTTDQTGRSVAIPINPKRIISLVPSQTELLHYLALDKKTVGITKFCVHPADWRKNKTSVGGTKILKYGVIDSLEPDLILANKEENSKEDILLLSENYPVWVSDVNSLDDAFEMIRSIGAITNASLAANALTLKIKASFSELNRIPTRRVLYLIWRKPYMAAGKQTFIDDLLGRCGFENVLSESRYPELKPSEIVRLNPEIVFFSSEPYPFKEHHMNFVQKLLPYAKMQLVDGEPFSWYGSRLLFSVAYFKKLQDILADDYS